MIKPVQQVLDEVALLPDELMKLARGLPSTMSLRWARCCGGCCRWWGFKRQFVYRIADAGRGAV